MEAEIRHDIAWSQVNADVLHSMESPRRIYWVMVGSCVVLIAIALVAYSFQFRFGLGVAELNRPQMWGPYIANFIFWVGVSHAGTLLSAALLITRTEWRRPVYRSAEAMTTCALLTAGLFPVLHLGRVWDVQWTFPFPNERELWPNFRSPLLWDLTAIFTYLNCSMLFLYYGMIPDLAIYRDKAIGWRKRLYSALSLGWTGTDRQWRNFRVGYLTLACFLLPLAISVHSVVSADFAMSNVAGWHVTSFPPYFVAGALYSGCAGIITLFIMLRRTFRFEEYLTLPILDKLCWITFAIAAFWSYLNLIEIATTLYGHDRFEMDALRERASGVYAPIWWFMIVGGMTLPFLLLWRRVRRHMAALMVLSLLMNVVMWLERWMILAPSLLRGYAPYGWGIKWPSAVEMLITLGALAWFTLLFLIFVKVFPAVSMYEVKEMLFEHSEASPTRPKPGEAHVQAT